MESPPAMVVSAGKLWMANVVAGPVSTSRTRRAGRAAEPRADADEAQLAAVRVHAVLIVGVPEHRLDDEAVARNRDDAAGGQDISVFRRSRVSQIGV